MITIIIFTLGIIFGLFIIVLVLPDIPFEPELLISYLTVAVLAITLIETIRKNRLSVTPKVKPEFNTDPAGENKVIFDAKLTNSGIGPGIIKKLYVIDKDKVYDFTTIKGSDEFRFDHVGELEYISNIAVDSGIKDGKSVQLFKTYPMEVQDADEKWAKIHITGTCESIYGKTFNI